MPGALAEIRALLATFGPRAWLVSALAAAVALFLIAVPTEIIDTPLFARMTPVRVQDYVLWLVSGILIGALAGTFVARDRPATGQGRLAAGGFLSFLAVGCPVCNKAAVLLLGTSGALTLFGPAQLYIGIASVLLLAWTLRLRARAVAAACPLPLGKPPRFSAPQP